MTHNIKNALREDSSFANPLYRSSSPNAQNQKPATSSDPDTDQLPGDVVPLGQRVQRLARDELLSNLPFECGAVGPMLRHGFHSPEAR
jgi:hypothetical protein